MVGDLFVLHESALEQHMDAVVRVLNGPQEDYFCLVLLVVSMLNQAPSGKLTSALVAMLTPKPSSMRFYSLLSTVIRKSETKPSVGPLLLTYLETEQDENLVYGILRVLKELPDIRGAGRLWKQCLFGDFSICKSMESRKLAYELIVNICRQFPE
jgi:hypothetical protein